MNKTNLLKAFKPQLKLSGLLVAVASLTLAAGVQAQSSSSSPSGYSMYGPGASYIGLNAGQSNFRLNNGTGGFPSDNTDSSYHLYGGSYFNENVGMELGYIDLGKATRAGGTTKAQGFDISLVGKLPLAQSFNLIGRLGTTYGRTEVSSNPASGVASGKESGWGLAYGLGLEYAFNPNWSTVLQYDERNLKFAGSGRDKVNTTSLGLRYRF